MSIAALKEEVIRQFAVKVESMEDEASLMVVFDFLNGIKADDKQAINLSQHYSTIKEKYGSVLKNLLNDLRSRHFIGPVGIPTHHPTSNTNYLISGICTFNTRHHFTSKPVCNWQKHTAKVRMICYIKLLLGMVSAGSNFMALSM